MTCIVASERNIDVDHGDDKLTGQSQSPPSRRIVGDSEIAVKEGSGQVCPQDVHEECQAGEHIQHEAIVFVRGDFGMCTRKASIDMRLSKQ